MACLPPPANAIDHAAVAENQPSLKNRMRQIDQFDTCRIAVLDFIRNPRLPASNQQFNNLAIALFRLQWNSIPHYRLAAMPKGLNPLEVDQWHQIPSLPTAAFKELDLSSIPAGNRTTTFFSSGTTGENRSRHHHSPDSLEVYESSLLHGFSSAILTPSEMSDAREGNPGLVYLSLCPPASKSPNSSLAHMLDYVGRELHWKSRIQAGITDRDGLWQLNITRVIETLDSAIRNNTPVFAAGTAFLWVHFLDFLGRSGRSFQLPPGSRIMETGGYKGRSRSIPRAELHHLISQALGIPPHRILCEYGMSELGSQAYDAIHGQIPDGPRRFRWPHWTRFQVISPESGIEVADGQPGLIRVFDLANVSSILAVQTGDLGTAFADGFELLGRAPDAENRGCSLRSE